MAKKGFTMIELVVATAVSAILTLALIGVLVPVYRTYQRTLDRADAGLIAGNVIDSIRAGANGAVTVTASSADGSDAVDVSRGLYGAKDGQLYFYDAARENPTPVFDAAYYNGKKIELTARQAGYNAVEVTVLVKGTDADLFTTTAVVSPLRNALDTESRFSPAGMHETAQAVIRAESASGASQADINAEILENVYGGAFPSYQVTSILEADKLTALKNAAEADGQTIVAGYYETLLHTGNTFYLATYVTRESLPILYLTDEPTGYAAETPDKGLMYMVYYSGVWYVAFPISTLRPPVYFNDMDAAELAAEMRSANWRTVASLSKIS